MKTEVIVALFNAPQLEQRCIHSVLQHTQDYQLTVFDNYPHRITIGTLWNRLISESTADYICLLNSDTEVEAGWLPGLMKGFSINPMVKVVGPSTNNCRTPQNEGRGAGYQLLEDLGGFCLMFPKAFWQFMGGFDETYPFYGQESDFNRRAREKGFKLLWMKEVFVWHAGSGSAKLAEARGEFNIREERRKGEAKYWNKKGGNQLDLER